MSLRTSIIIDAKDNTKAVRADINRDIKQWEKGVTLKVNVDGIDKATSQLEQLRSKAETVGNFMSTIGDIGSSIGNAMQSIGNMFGGNVINTAKRVATAYGTRGLAGAIQGTIERYDTLRLFPKRMAHVFGESEKTTKAAAEAMTYLEESVIGLPTGLDEIVSSANQLIPLMGDIEKGSRLAVAANNAFIAGGADSLQQMYGQRQIRDLLAAKGLRSQEWDSLFKSLGAGLGVIAEEMGYSGKAGKRIKQSTDQLDTLRKTLKSLEAKKTKFDVLGGKPEKIAENAEQIEKVSAALAKMEKKQDKDLNAFRNDLKQGKIDAEDFVDALISAGSIDPKTGKVGKLVEWSDDMKDTISAATENINNAVKRLGDAGLTALNAILEEGTGKTLVEHIKGISGVVKNELIPALNKWMYSHQDEILNFFDRLSSYDWVALAGKVGSGLAKYYDYVTKFFTMFSPDWIAKMAVWFGPVGKIISGFSGVVGKIGDLITKVAIWKTSKKLFAATEAAGGLGKFTTGFADAFKGLALGAGFVGLIGEIGLVIAEYAKIAEMIGKIKIGSNFKGNMLAITEVVTGVTAFATALVGGFSMVAESGVGAGIAGIAELLSAGFVGIIGEIGAVLIEFTHLANEISAVKLPNEGKMTDFFVMIADIGEALSETGGVGKWFNAWTGSKVVSHIDDALKSVIGIVDSISQIQEKITGLQGAGKYGVRDGTLDMSMITSFMETMLKNVQRITQIVGDISTRLAEYNASKKAKSISKTMKSITDIIGSVADIQDAIVKVNGEGRFAVSDGKVAWDEYFTTVRNIVDTMLDITEHIDNKSDLFPEWITTGKTSNLSKSISKVNDIIVTIADMQDNISHLNRRGAFGVTNGLYDSKLDFDKFNDAVEEIVTGMMDITQTINAHSDVFSTFLADAKSQSLFDAVDNINDLIGAIAEIQTSISSLNDPSRFGVHNLGGGTGKLSMNSITKAIEEIITPIGEALKSLDISNVEDKVGSFKALGDSMVHVKDAITQIHSMQGQIGDLVDDNLSFSVGYKLQAIVESFSTFNKIASEDLSSLGENAGNIKTAVDKIIETLKALQQATETINGLVTGESGNFSFLVGEKLLHAFTILKLAFGIAKGTIGGEGSLVEVAPALQDIAKQLGAIGTNGDKAATNLTKAGGGVDTLGESAKTHGDTINKLAGYIKALKTALSGIDSNASGAAGGIDEVGNAAARQINNLYSAAAAASSLASAIASIPSSKTVTMNVAGNATGGLGFSLGKTLGSLANKLFASGGPVYGPGGIDNVPARLTSGEFVMTKRAHTAFGSRFMNSINNLDVEGAMRALSLRAGSGVFNRARVTNNYTRDNHANVTFNVNRASQGYSQRRASRWARALS